MLQGGSHVATGLGVPAAQRDDSCAVRRCMGWTLRAFSRCAAVTQRIAPHRPASATAARWISLLESHPTPCWCVCMFRYGQGFERPLVELLGQHSPIPVTYAGGARSLADCEEVLRPQMALWSPSPLAYRSKVTPSGRRRLSAGRGSRRRAGWADHRIGPRHLRLPTPPLCSPLLQHTVPPPPPPPWRHVLGWMMPC